MSIYTFFFQNPRANNSNIADGLEPLGVSSGSPIHRVLPAILCKPALHNAPHWQTESEKFFTLVLFFCASPQNKVQRTSPRASLALNRSQHCHSAEEETRGGAVSECYDKLPCFLFSVRAGLVWGLQLGLRGRVCGRSAGEVKPV